MRYNVINHLAKAYYNNDCSYLEIGVENPDNCFNIINASKKTSVDPQKIGSHVEIDYNMTYDRFFEYLEDRKTEFAPDYKWDIIFIDGLHLAEQVYRDIQNAVKHCKGFVVLHDCAPEKFYNAHSDYNYFLANRGAWNGSTWKAFYKFRTETNLKTYTVDVDHGIGIIEMNNTGMPIEFKNTWFEYGKFKESMNYDLGLVMPQQFINMHPIKE